jgi:hypothetical protein
LRGEPDVTFKKIAHAAPEFLGNKSIRSMNECDSCNEFLAYEYEDHLSKWTQLARSLSRVPGKGGAPTFINPDGSIRVESEGGRLIFHVRDPELFGQLAAMGDGPFHFDLPADATSSKHVPLRAAKALVKIACSICPAGDLGQCCRAIDWLMNRSRVRTSNFPVLYGFTPGPPEEFKSRAILLRRKQTGPEPYLWCVVQFANHRLQAFVPCCPIDDSLFLRGEPFTIPTWHYRLPEIGFDWPFGESEYYPLNWSSQDAVQHSPTPGFHVVRAEAINKAAR